jgi:hypothetical protein
VELGFGFGGGEAIETDRVEPGIGGGVASTGEGRRSSGESEVIEDRDHGGTRKKLLAALFEDRNRLGRMVLTFIVVFASFINDPAYFIRGIDRAGVHT